MTRSTSIRRRLLFARLSRARAAPGRVGVRDREQLLCHHAAQPFAAHRGRVETLRDTRKRLNGPNVFDKGLLLALRDVRGCPLYGGPGGQSGPQPAAGFRLRAHDKTPPGRTVASRGLLTRAPWRSLWGRPDTLIINMAD